MLWPRECQILNHWPHRPRYFSYPRSRSGAHHTQLDFLCETTPPSVGAYLCLLLLYHHPLYFQERPVSIGRQLYSPSRTVVVRGYIYRTWVGLIPTSMPWAAPLLGSVLPMSTCQSFLSIALQHNFVALFQFSPRPHSISILTTPYHTSFLPI